MAHRFGLITWTLDVRGDKPETYKDTAGPGEEAFFDMLDKVEGQLDRKGYRDRAMLRLLHDLALRRDEVLGLDFPRDVHFGKEPKVDILAKRKSERQPLSLPPETAQAIKDWLKVRGDWAGPLFTNFDTSGKGDRGGRLDGSSLYRIVRKYGEQIGLHVRPHGLRHTAITKALDETHDLRAVQRFSRHEDIRTLKIYDDNRQDLGGEVAKKVAKRNPSNPPSNQDVPDDQVSDDEEEPQEED
jgi:integrase/recombinase XerC